MEYKNYLSPLLNVYRIIARFAIFIILLLFTAKAEGQAALNLTFFIQGFYIGGNTMQPVLYNSAAAIGNTYPNMTDCDYVTVNLLDPVNYSLIESVQGILNINGHCNVSLNTAIVGNAYYIDICHRNAIQTMSALPVTISNVTNYNFSDDPSKAYGQNMAQVEPGVWAFFIGDINHDCYIATDDGNILNNDFGAAGYACSDLNGDGVVDASDFLIWDYNNQLSIYCQFPDPACMQSCASCAPSGTLPCISGILWQDSFGIQNGLCLPQNHGWSVSNIGTQGSHANEWYLSDPVNCDLTNTCFKLKLQPDSNGALYVGFGRDPGNLSSCDSSLTGSVYRKDCNNFTHKRAESPSINCTGYNNLSLEFDFIGRPRKDDSDYVNLLYSIDGGANWLVLQNRLHSLVCYNKYDGFWTHVSYILPASINNSQNVKFGFEWYNDEDCLGFDPSFAVDNFKIKCACPPINITFESTDCGNTICPIVSGGCNGLYLYSWTPAATPLVYLNANYAFGDSYYIESIVLGSINNISGPSSTPWNTYFSNLNTNLISGITYNLMYSLGSQYSYVAAWIDYNHDGVYSQSEKLGETGWNIFNLSFTVPVTACNGVTRMRVRSSHIANNMDAYSYVIFGTGEAEDYNVTIIGGTNSCGANCINNLLPNTTYTLTVTDAAGNTASKSISKPQVSSVVTVTGAVPNVLFSIALTVIQWGCGPPYTYLWGTGQTTQNISNVYIGGGIYCYTITDACGNKLTCCDSLPYNQPSTISIVPTTVNPTCNGNNNGSILLNVSGGTSSYHYLWSNGSTLAAINNIGAGVYTCLVTDAGGITGSTSVMITSPPPLIINSAPVHLACYGDSTSLRIFPAGGTAPYTYEWNTHSSSQNLSGVFAGSYSVTTTDINGCSAAATFNLINPLVMTPAITPGIIQCYGGTACIDVTAAGGVPPFTGTGNFCGYGQGNYVFTVSDSLGCAHDISTIVQEPAKLVLTASATPTSCVQNNGTAIVNVSGGTTGYNYLWTPGGQTTPIDSGLGVGTYTIKVTDANGCTATANAAVVSSGSIPTAPVQIIGPASACIGQTGILFSTSPSAGATSYTWTLPSGATGISTSTTISISFGNNFKGGIICVKAVNACGKSANVCRNISLISSSPATPAQITGPSSLCPLTNRTYSIMVVPNATSYTWTTTGGLTILSGQGTNSVVVSSPAGFTSGTLKVKASNCKGISGIRSKNITGVPAVPALITGTTSVCKSQTIAYSISSITGATSYTWTVSGGSTISSGQGTAHVNVSFLNSTLNTITLTVIANNACGASAAKTINITVNLSCNKPGYRIKCN